MRLAMIGLGRMGGDLTRRLMADGHEVVVLDPGDIVIDGEVWRRNSVIGSWLLDLTACSLALDPGLDAYESLLTAEVQQRFASQGNGEMAGKVLSAMRHASGDHLEEPGPLDGEGGDH